MTVSVNIMNVGNHPDDRVTLERANGTIVELARGEGLEMYRGDTVTYAGEEHGSGELCRDHIGMAVCVEGPGRGLVRTDFNPSNNTGVDRLKALSAALINEIEVQGKDGRLSALARTAAEEAAMWAVKSATA